MTPDEKKHLFIGGIVGVLAGVVGHARLSGRRAHAGLPSGHGEHHGQHHHHHDGGEVENDRGEYGRKHKHHHGGHGND